MVRNLFATPTKKDQKKEEKDTTSTSTATTRTNDNKDVDPPKETKEATEKTDIHTTSTSTSTATTGTKDNKDVDSQNVTKEVKERTKDTEEDRQSTSTTNTIPPSPQPKRTIKTLVTRKHWSKQDEDIICQEASAIITGNIKATRINIFSTIQNRGALRRIARRETEERLFEKIKTLHKVHQKKL